MDTHLAIFVISDILAESRADEEYDPKDMKAMVQSMAKIVMTTMSSTSVKAFFLIDIVLYI